MGKKQREREREREVRQTICRCDMWCFGVLKQNKLQSFQPVSNFHAKMVAQHFAPDEVIHFIMDVAGDGVESNEKKEEV